MIAEHQGNGGPQQRQASDRLDDDLKEQVAQIRAELQTLVAKVQQLMRDDATRATSDFAGCAEETVLQAKGAVRAKIEAISEDVRERPLTALLLAAIAGYIAGRIYH